MVIHPWTYSHSLRTGVPLPGSKEAGELYCLLSSISCMLSWRAEGHFTNVILVIATAYSCTALQLPGLPDFLPLSSIHFPTPASLKIGSNEVVTLPPKTTNAPSPVHRLNVLGLRTYILYAMITQTDLTPKPNGNQKDPPATIPAGWSAGVAAISC